MARGPSEGSAVLALGPETSRYRFGSGVTDFLLCGRCGVYAGALVEIDGALDATLNLNAFDAPASIWPRGRSLTTARARRRGGTGAA